MRSRTQQILEVRAALSHALGAAQLALAAAESRLTAARQRRDRTREAAARGRRRLAAERDDRLTDIARQRAGDLTRLAAVAAAAAATDAPGAAGAPWSLWQPTPVPRAAAPPELRVGHLALPAPAGRPALPGAEGPPAPTGSGEEGGPGERPTDGAGSSAAPGASSRAGHIPAGAGHGGRGGSGAVVSVPALVPLLDRGHIVLDGGGPGADDMVAALLLRALGTVEPGTLRLTGYDPEHLGGGLGGFAALASAGLLTFVGPGGLGQLLDERVEHIRRINETVLAGDHPSLAALAAAAGRRPEPWRLAVLLGGDEPTRHERGQLDRILRTGAACGVHLIIRGLRVELGAGVEVVRLGADGRARLSGCGDLPVALDPGPPAALVAATCRELAERVAEGPAPLELDALLPADEWTQSSAAALTGPIGESPQGRTVAVTLGDYPPHALIAGPSGTGKTNLIYAWMGSLAARYSPDELAFYLLDFKEGVSFARFAPGRRDPSWLPHVRLVGVNVNTDREFGLALLRFLGEQLRRRADAAKRYEVTKLAELRAEDPDGHWPRIVAVIDEFQVLLAGRDALAAEVVELLEDLARRGRSQGIHLVLASQDVTGIEALWGRPSLIAQFSLRIALPKARRILAETNTAAEMLPRHHAVINADSGAAEANRVIRVPNAGDRSRWYDLQHRLWRNRPDGTQPPRLFDGDAVPQLASAPDFLALRMEAVTPVALLGETIDVAARSARFALRRAPGRNLAVLGTRAEEATAVLHAAAASLAAQLPGRTARFSVVCLDADARDAVEALHPVLPAETGWYDAADVTDLLADTAASLRSDAPHAVPHLQQLYAGDAAAGRRAAGTGRDDLREILRLGPERHAHLLGWWRSVGRLRDDLGGAGSRTDAIGAWVALDVHGAELAAFHPGHGGPAWYPRPWRALYFDRATHRSAEAIIPYGPS